MQIGRREFLRHAAVASITLAAGTGGAYSADRMRPNVPQREILAGDRTYYVSTAGDDSSDGSSVRTALRTIQAAYDKIAYGLDVNNKTVTIQVADGTYAQTFDFKSDWLGGGNVIIQGNVSTPSNCVITGAMNQNCINFFAGNSVDITIRGFKLTNSAESGIVLQHAGASIILSNMEWGSCAKAHIWVAGPGNCLVYITGPNVISGGATVAWNAESFAEIYTDPLCSFTLTERPNFTTSFVHAQGAFVEASNTFTGSATGVRYISTLNAVVLSGDGTTTFFPGNVAGYISMGGQYL